MKFTKIRFAGPTNVDLPLDEGVLQGPFILKAADGLGPPEVDVSMAHTLNQGGVYQGRRPQLREPVFRVGLQPEWNIGQSAEELRTTLYGLLTPKFGQLIKMQIMNGAAVVAEVDGHIKKMEIAAFSKDPEVQITMACTQPYLYAPSNTFQAPVKTVSGGFTLFDVVNIGTAPSGFHLALSFTVAHTATLQLIDEYAFGENMSINTDFAIGDILTIDTRAGSRGVWKTLSGQSTSVSILDDLTGGSSWMQLHSGTNRLKINNTTFNWFLLGVTHRPEYWGI